MDFLKSVVFHPAALPIFGAGAAWLAQKALGARRWAWVRKKAHAIIGDQADPIDNPRAAIEKALSEAMRVEILKNARKLQAHINGATK